MRAEPQTIVEPKRGEPGLSDRTFGVITIEAKDLRPFVLRPWSATAIATVWALDDPVYGSHYLRARSKDRLVAKAMKALRRSAERLGIENPIIHVDDGSLDSQDDRGLSWVAPIEADYEVEVISAGAGRG